MQPWARRSIKHGIVRWNETSLVRAFYARYRILFCLSLLHHRRRAARHTLFADHRPAMLDRGLATKPADPHAHFPSSLWLRVADV